jgi:hypothetical protein
MLRGDIVTKAVSLAFAERNRALANEIRHFAEALYVLEVGGKEAHARALGVEWVEYKRHVPVSSSLWHGDEELEIDRDLPHPLIWGYRNGIKVESDHPMAAQLKALEKVRAKIEADKKQLKSNLHSIMAGVYSVEKLRERWPECDAVLPLNTGMPVVKYEIVPVTLVNDINKALGIPSNTTPLSKAMAK